MLALAHPVAAGLSRVKATATTFGEGPLFVISTVRVAGQQLD